MPKRYQWFIVKDNKLDAKKPLMDITVNDAQKVLGLLIFNFPQTDDLDFVLNQIRYIKKRTIGAYPRMLNPEEKWGPLEPDNKPKGANFIEIINEAKNNILNMNVIDAVERWLGNHKVKVGNKSNSFVESLYLDADDKIWTVGEIADESNHEEFDQSLISYGQPDLNRLQQRVFDVEDPVILNKENLDNAIKNLEVKKIKKSGGLDSKSNTEKLSFTINFGFYNDKIHQKRLKKIFRGQKIVFLDNRKKEEYGSGPERKLNLPLPKGEMKVVEDDPKEGGLKESEIRGTVENPAQVGWKRVPEKFEDLTDKEIEDLGLKDYHDAMQERWQKWHQAGILSGIDVENLMDEHSSEDIKNWLLNLWDNENDTLWHHFKNILPLSLTSIGTYSIDMTLTSDLTEQRPPQLQTDWTYNQTQELEKRFLIEPAGVGTTSIQQYNLGPNAPDHTKVISVPSERRKDLQTKGYNTYRNFLANFVTSRLNQLDNAITQSDAQGE
jgi:hypothetical protein